jgi:RNA polymerase-binding transcription factor DksA
MGRKKRPGAEDTAISAVSEKEKLEKELAQAREELELINEKLEEKGDFGLGQGASTVYEWEMNLGLRQAAEAKIKSLEAALERLGEGAYGICKECGQPIDPARLEILPDTTLCVSCAQAKR